LTEPGASMAGSPDRGSIEVERIRHAYDAYERNPQVRRRWDRANPGNRAIHGERAIAVRTILDKAALLPLGGRRILDVGCGSGQVLAGMTTLGAEPECLHGVDLRSEEIAIARQLHADMSWHCGNAERLDFASSSFALVLAFTVFSSVLDDGMARNLAAEIGRVLEEDGAVLWYDFRTAIPYNKEVRGMPLARVRALFPGWTIDLRPITLLPPLARALRWTTPLTYGLLASVPPLRTHLVGLLRKPGAGARRGSGTGDP
jgi:SAM-dependent methyltransferase